MIRIPVVPAGIKKSVDVVPAVLDRNPASVAMMSCSWPPSTNEGLSVKPIVIGVSSRPVAVGLSEKLSWTTSVARPKKSPSFRSTW